MRIFSQEFVRDNSTTRICIEYGYEDDIVVITKAWEVETETSINLTQAEDERMCAWINEHRFWYDRDFS